MPAYLTRESSPGQGRDLGVGPALPWGFVPPIAVRLGLGVAQRMPQADRLEVSTELTPGEDRSTFRRLRLQDPRTLDAGRLLDYGAPAPLRAVEYAPFAYRPTEAPDYFQQPVALGGRLVGFGR